MSTFHSHFKSWNSTFFFFFTIAWEALPFCETHHLANKQNKGVRRSSVYLDKSSLRYCKEEGVQLQWNQHLFAICFPMHHNINPPNRRTDYTAVTHQVRQFRICSSDVMDAEFTRSNTFYTHLNNSKTMPTEKKTWENPQQSKHEIEAALPGSAPKNQEKRRWIWPKKSGTEGFKMSQDLSKEK